MRMAKRRDEMRKGAEDVCFDLGLQFLLFMGGAIWPFHFPLQHFHPVGISKSHLSDGINNNPNFIPRIKDS